MNHSSQQLYFSQTGELLVVSECSPIANSTTFLSLSQAGIPLMPGYVHQLILGYSTANKVFLRGNREHSLAFYFYHQPFVEKLTENMY